ncbi:putative quinol monooxygenase [Tropicimonas marinistellae]|uniref:putative quinol monooxygenase n=1 Tax=Tropicimonas marinistellae TaxID=1739787 RepID=UPI000836F64E|nr:antibiotic biosynthesis monooxygenase family protein [Tropicimonas marinistellae]
MDESSQHRKYIVGRLFVRPGHREAFVALLPDYMRYTLREPGCLFFEMAPSMLDPNVIVIAECFASPAAHSEHLKAEPFRKMWSAVNTMCDRGEFDNVFAGSVETDVATFDATSLQEPRY